MKYYLIVNELHLKGKNVKKLEEIKAVFARAGKQCEVLPTDHAGHAKEYAKKLSSDGCENTLIAVGGDGTLHEILNGVSNFELNSLGIIPFGTGNDFAAAANIPINPVEAAERIAFRAPQYIDFIQLSSGLRSINAVGMGVDVEVLKRVYAGKKHGKSKYLRSFIISAFKFKGIDVTIEYDGNIERHSGLIAALGNGMQIGGGIKLFPEAKIDDGYMDLFMVDYISRRKMIAAFIKLMRGKVNTLKKAKAVRVKKAKIITPQDNFMIQAEGEIYDNIPIDAEVVSGKLKFYL